MDNGTAAIGQTVQRAGGKLRLQDTKTEDSDSLLPLPDLTWLVLLDHQERQRKERARLAEVWQDHGLVVPSEASTPMGTPTLM